MKYYIAFDPERCCACHACSVACMDQNDTDVEAGELPLRRVFNEELGCDVLDCAYLSAACAHCDDAPCVMACPVGCLQMTIPGVSADEAVGWPVPSGRPAICRTVEKWSNAMAAMSG